MSTGSRNGWRRRGSWLGSSGRNGRWGSWSWSHWSGRLGTCGGNGCWRSHSRRSWSSRSNGAHSRNGNRGSCWAEGVGWHRGADGHGARGAETRHEGAGGDGHGQDGAGRRGANGAGRVGGGEAQGTGQGDDRGGARGADAGVRGRDDVHLLGQRAYAVEVLVRGLVDVDGGAIVTLAAADVAAWRDNVHVDGVAIVVHDGRRERGLGVERQTLGSETNGSDKLDTALGRHSGGEEGEP